MSTVQHTIENGISRIRLNRPERLNAFNWTLIRELHNNITEAVREPSVRVIIFSGEGRAFSAGADLKDVNGQIEDIQSGKIPLEEFREIRHKLQDITRTLRQSSKVSIAAVHGWVQLLRRAPAIVKVLSLCLRVGGGLEVPLACDFIVAGESAKFYFAEARAGLTITGGATRLLPLIVGLANARKLILLAEPVDAQEAYRMGMLAEVVPDDRLEHSVMALAQKVMANSPVSVAAHKRMLELGPSIGLEGTLALELETNANMYYTEDAIEGSKAFAEKREPRFKGQ